MPQPIGLIAAIAEEHDRLGDAFREDAVTEIAGRRFRAGTLDGRPVVAVRGGIGKVNAAMTATLLVHAFGCRALVFAGIAGGLDPSLDVGDVVIGERLVCHDYGAVIDGTLQVFQPGAPPVRTATQRYGYHLPSDLAAALRAALADAPLPPLDARVTGGAPRTPRIVFGTILTGDAVINCAATRERLYAEHAGHAVEMEGAAVAQVAKRFGVPAVVVRALSDLAGAGRPEDFTAFLSETAEVAAVVVRRVLAAL
jgi:adenosylhomocysteine nucleosidase